jgi:YidC/Oxa1 family membrane protein insertase
LLDFLFGWLWDLMQLLLDSFYGFTGSYGSSIILLTLGIRVLLFPLVSKQTNSMKKMQALQPEIEKIQEEYDDKQKVQEETMKLYQEHKVNPAAGCLPLLVQMPILIALFRTLRSWDALAGEAFLLIPNLSEPYIPLVFLTGLVMLGQTIMTQKLQGKDIADNKMILFMPLLIIFIGFRLPAGVLLYLFTSNLVMATQQYFLYSGDSSDLELDLKEESQ